MEPEAAKLLTSLGVGGALAAFMFWAYRKDSQTNATRLSNLVGETLKALANVQTMLGEQRVFLQQMADERRERLERLIERHDERHKDEDARDRPAPDDDEKDDAR
jgi:hypothetical protein